MIDSSFKRGLSLWRKLLLISWCWLLWCERRRRHVRSNAEVDHLGLWRRQRQVQASEQRPAEQLSYNHTTFWFNYWHHSLDDLLMYTIFYWFVNHGSLFRDDLNNSAPVAGAATSKGSASSSSSSPLQLFVKAKKKINEIYTEVSWSWAHLQYFSYSFVTWYLFIIGRRLCHIFIEVLERSTRERHRGRHKGQRQSHRLLQKGRKCQP